MKIIHLSDIHIGKSNNKKRFDSIVNWITIRMVMVPRLSY
jgi:3',5'-cyclic AMP phosphodiesterase CpdA